MGVSALRDLYSDFESDGENILLLKYGVQIFGCVSIKELVEFYVENNGPYTKVGKKF